MRFDRLHIKIIASTIVLLIAVLLVVLEALHSHWAYGDWSCAFKTCVAVRR